ncbi:MAG TPA: Holliday junction branch migration protein RuvA [Spirochaetaceae bacterium]|nr:Holliday junction branch migration protein RuvA [Spirochaetaceae bacterium]
MFNRIRGVFSGHAEDALHISTGAVEWEIFVPVRDPAFFTRTGEETELFTWLHHYEDGMKLYGFFSVAERQLFLDLQKVEGIGPRQAFKILQGIAPRTLATMLDNGDLASLQKIPGIGPKTAQKMMLALKGKLIGLEGEPGTGATGSQGRFRDVVRALVEMGFDRKEVERVVANLGTDLQENPDVEKELFRKALLELSTGAGS